MTKDDAEDGGRSVMDIAVINEQLTAHEPEQMELRAISEGGSTLTLAFLCHGGPMEDREFLVALRQRGNRPFAADPSRRGRAVQAFVA